MCAGFENIMHKTEMQGKRYGVDFAHYFQLGISDIALNLSRMKT